MKFWNCVRGAVCAIGIISFSIAAVWAQPQDSLSNSGAFDPDEYPPHAVSDLISRDPCSGTQVYELKDILFQTELLYGGILRSTPPETSQLLKNWTVKVSSSDQSGQFSQELSVQDGDTQRWVAVSQTVLNYLKKDFKAGDKVTFFMSYVGCVTGQPFFAIEEYSSPNYEDLEEGADSYVA